MTSFWKKSAKENPSPNLKNMHSLGWTNRWWHHLSPLADSQRLLSPVPFYHRMLGLSEVSSALWVQRVRGTVEKQQQFQRCANEQLLLFTNTEVTHFLRETSSKSHLLKQKCSHPSKCENSGFITTSNSFLIWSTAFIDHLLRLDDSFRIETFLKPPAVTIASNPLREWKRNPEVWLTCSYL